MKSHKRGSLLADLSVNRPPECTEFNFVVPPKKGGMFAPHGLAPMGQESRPSF
jgi:hypothetical protein